ncbi:hypothetical protein [Microlunatus speluncae]|uniref:hypothetical protein n=1 Tax=Microlunatus speluncae TaxID=2594267 RepID=UPI0012661FDF|nr:hypothetical protein [Microlunatus speluncae]
MTEAQQPLRNESAAGPRAAGMAAVRALTPVLAITVAGVVGVFGYRYFSDRFDFAAHYVAGLGGTMLLLAVLGFGRRRRREWSVVVLTVIACLLGVGCELVLFPGGGFDLVDVANQSLGALTAGIVFALWPVRGLAVIIWLVLAFGFLGGGGRLVGLL